MKQLFHITPYDAVKTVQPVFLIRIGEKYCSFAIVDHASQELKQMAYYSADEIDDNFLIELFDVYPELAVEPYQIFVCYDYPQQTMIPLKYYQAEDAPLLLQAVCGNTNDASVVSEPVAGWQMYNVYAVPKDIYEWFTKKFPGGKYHHHYSVAIKSIAGADASGCISIDFATESFSLLVGQSNAFLLANNFSYTTPADVVYYLLKICRQFNFSQQDVKLVLSGLIEKDSALYKILHQYFINVGFRNALWEISSKEYPAHFFTSLNDLALCAS